MSESTKSFDKSFREAWDRLYSDTTENSTFKSRLTGTVAKTLDTGYAVLYNPDINAKRTPKPQNITATASSTAGKKPEIVLPFDETRWNFSKISRASMLAFYDSKSDIINYDTTQLSCRSERDFNLYHFYVNEYPLAMYHSLIVPDPTLKYPQVFVQNCFLDVLKLYYCSFDKDNYGIGFNSGDIASVNNLHFQVLRLSEFYEGSQTAIEAADRETIMKIDSSDFSGEHEIFVQALVDYAIRGFAIQIPESLDKNSIVFKDVIEICERMIGVLVENQISHNVIFIKNTVYVMPCKAQNPNRDLRIHRGWIELTGLSKCLNQEAYDSVTAGETVKGLFRKYISLDEAPFEELQAAILSGLKDLEFNKSANLFSDLILCS